MERNLPSLKAKPELIPGVLRIINEYQGNYSKIEERVIQFWREKSHRKKPPTSRNSMRAVFGPTLRHLQLVRGEGDDIKILPPGKRLLFDYEKKGESEYRKLLAKHLVKLDKGKWLNILGHLQNSIGESSVSHLLERLYSKAPNSGINRDRLMKFLLYCEYVGLVSMKNRSVRLRESQYRISKKKAHKRLGNDRFFKLLYQEYKLLRSKEEGSPYVPIPDIRDGVCERSGIWLGYFDEKLKEIPKETKHYLIQLTQPMVRKPDGITIDGKYLYYIAIYKKGEPK